MIEKLLYEGWGLSRTPDGIAMVPYSCPGDTLTLKPAFQQKKSLRFAEIETIVTASPERVTPRCSVFTECGGCHWQHVSQAAQLHWKVEILRENFSRMAKLPDTQILPIIAAEDPWRYRNHVTWHVEAETQKPGFRTSHHSGHDHAVISFDDCVLLPEVINTLYHQCEALLTQFPLTDLKWIDVRWNESFEILMTLQLAELESTKKMVLGSYEKLAIQLTQNSAFQLKGLLISDGHNQHVVYGERFLLYDVMGYRFQVTAGAFFQSNSKLLAPILEAVLSRVEPQKTVLDLYAGGGFFSIPLAKQSKHVTTIESNAAAVFDCEANAQRNGVENVTIHCADATACLAQTQETFEIALLDPPRTGCDAKVLEALATCVTEHLLYLSCNPVTLARDTKLLLDTGHWKLAELQPFDLFPQTYHLETLAVFEKTV